MLTLTPEEEYALWAQVDAAMRGKQIGSLLTQRQQDYLLESLAHAVADFEALPQEEQMRLLQEPRCNS